MRSGSAPVGSVKNWRRVWDDTWPDISENDLCHRFSYGRERSMHSVMEQPDEQQIRQFLLGELSEGPRLELEERLFGDDHYYKNILAIQEELADDYVQDNLTLSERTNFEQNFLRSSRRKERVEFAEALSRALVGSEVPVLVAPQAASWWKYVAAI